MDSKFGSLTIPELEKELKKRNAKQSGRKKDLVERLEAYERNLNFGQSDVSAPDYYITLPEKSNYKDVNSDTKFCPIILEKVNDYLEAFDKNFDIALTKKIYDEKFLLFFPPCK
ncbi:uncharacterized protein LOC132722856 [Ruditapes philippinarum]|uniref:uncharacterized protein LOC132722856 n=1 Tax=Ruditapes philippinarum TaxID=129788 RepID=UPI00295BBD09|nr:uncharacterized protein LOC132722856 [Ruditapes philippinarum]